MRKLIIGLIGACLAGPALAQDLGQVGRLLGDQLLPRQDNSTNDRDAYERGRRDAERDGQQRRDERAVRGDDRRGNDRREQDRRDVDRRRDDQRALVDREEDRRRLDLGGRRDRNDANRDRTARDRDVYDDRRRRAADE